MTPSRRHHDSDASRASTRRRDAGALGPRERLQRRWHHPHRLGFFALGSLMLLLGLIGAFLPVMPSTIFLIAAAWCFGRSSPQLEEWLLHHPRFGPTLRQWQEEGAVAPRAKVVACIGMAAGYALLWIGSSPGPTLAVAVAIFMAGGAAYVITRPSPRGQARRGG